jgi:hypothetical protein
MRLAQERYASHADMRRVDVQFGVGDQVFLSTQHLAISAPSPKFRARWIGPFVVTQQVSPVAYKLRLPTTLRKLHPVFHVSLLKAARSDPINPIPPHPDPILASDGEEEWEVQEILSKKVVGNRAKYYCRFVGFEPEHDEWIWEEDMFCPQLKEAFDRAWARLHPEQAARLAARARPRRARGR